MKSLWITGLVLASLAACGPLQQSKPGGQFFAGISSIVSGGGDSGEAGTGETLDRAFIEAQPTDLMRMSIISADSTALLINAGTNGSILTWLSTDGVSVSFDNGLLVGTRGFGDDLMGADVAAAKASLNGGGKHLRTLDFMNGLDEIVRQEFNCVTVVTGSETIEIFDRNYATRVLEETCTSDSETFKNTYWRDSSGVIWQARQWISTEVGYLGYQRL